MPPARTNRNARDTQGSDLPSSSEDIRKPKIAILGKEISSLNRWLAEVSFALKPLGIKRVLDSSIQRPRHSDPSYKRWEYWSTYVAAWLFCHVSERIQNKLCSSKQRTPQSFLDDDSGLQYADETMKAIIDIVEPGNRNDYVMAEIQKHRGITRARYRSAKEYIVAYEAQTSLLESKLAAPAPVYALTTVLRELKGELPVIKEMEREIAEHTSDEVTFTIFHNYCRDIESECNEIQRRLGSDPTARSGNYNRR